ncbi:MAG: hypothetical protein ACFFBD_23585 [Candidatus Hodarchaeota archaeon]
MSQTLEISLLVFSDQGIEFIASTDPNLTIGSMEAMQIFSSVTFGDHWGSIRLLQGPIKSTASEHYFVFPFNLNDQQTDDPRIRKFGHLSIFLLQVKKDSRCLEIFSKRRENMNNKLTDLVSRTTKKDYPYTMINNINICRELRTCLISFLNLCVKALDWGDSLYNIGTVFQLPPEMQIIAKSLIEKPRSLEELKNLHPELQEKLLDILNDMKDIGYIKKTPLGEYSLK